MKRSYVIARHEAAHAVVAETLGYSVTKVEMYPKGKVLGMCFNDMRHRPGPLSQGIVSAAGSVVDQQHGVCRSYDWSSGDLRNLRKLGYKSTDLPHLQYLTGLYVKALAPKIRRVATELVKRDLTGAEIRRIIRRRK